MVVQTRHQKKQEAASLAATNNSTTALTIVSAAVPVTNSATVSATLPTVAAATLSNTVPATLPPASAGQKRASDSAGSERSPKRVRRGPSPDLPDEQAHQPDVEPAARPSRKRSGPVEDNAGAGNSGRPTKKSRSDVPPTDESKVPPKRQPPRGKGKAAKRPATTPDEIFLEQAIAQFKALKPARGTARAAQVSSIVPLLNAMSAPEDQNVRTSIDDTADEQDDAPDAYYLSSEDAAEFLNSNQAIYVPVFVADGAAKLRTEPGDTRRPIEQALKDWFVDSSEELSYYDPSDKAVKHLLTTVTLDEVREHFLLHTGHESSATSENSAAGPSSAPQPSSNPLTCLNPWNFPDMINPQAAQSIPAFLRSPQCSLLHDIMRSILHIESEDICHPGCATVTAETTSTGPCSAHLMSLQEMNLLHLMYAYWRGTLMISDPGTITTAHFDKWSLGTFISIYEGEVGLAWLPYPSTEEQMACFNDEKRIPERAVFKVMRPGDAVYMPPGTVHIVFRLPEGSQTLGVAGHVLRRGANLHQWLEMLGEEMKNVVDNPYKYDTQALVVPPLIAGLKRLLDRVESADDRERLGGEEVLTRARAAIEVLEGLVPRLVRLQSRADNQVAAAKKRADAAEKKKQIAAEKRKAKSKKGAAAEVEAGAEDQDDAVAGPSDVEPAVIGIAEQPATCQPAIDQPMSDEPTLEHSQQQEPTSTRAEPEAATTGAISIAPTTQSSTAQATRPVADSTREAIVPSGWLETLDSKWQDLLGQGPATP